MQLLVALKVRYPQRITILRGNHESRQVCSFPFFNFSFLSDCEVKIRLKAHYGPSRQIQCETMNTVSNRLFLSNYYLKVPLPPIESKYISRWSKLLYMSRWSKQCAEGLSWRKYEHSGRKLIEVYWGTIETSSIRGSK